MWFSDEIRQHQEEDDDLKTVVDCLQNNTFLDRCPPSASWKLQSLWTQRRNLVLTDGILYRQWEDIPGGGRGKGGGGGGVGQIDVFSWFFHQSGCQTSCTDFMFPLLEDTWEQERY